MTMLKVDPKSLSRAKFVCSVLWMNGSLPTAEIAKKASATVKKNITPGVVRGYATRLFDKPRQSMTQEERQSVLDILNGLRGTIGVMEYKMQDTWFRAAPLKDVGGHRPVEAEPTFDLSTKAGRRAKRNHNAKKASANKSRESGLAERRGAAASPLQYLFAGNLLADRGSGKSDEIATSKRRWNAAEKFSQYIEGARTSAFGAMDYERATMGSGSSQKLSLPAYKLFCMDSLAALHVLLDAAEFEILESLIDRQEFVWEHTEAQSRERQNFYETLRYLLDVVSVHEQWMSREDFTARWKQELPYPEHRPSMSAARSTSAGMEDFMRKAK